MDTESDDGGTFRIDADAADVSIPALARSKPETLNDMFAPTPVQRLFQEGYAHTVTAASSQLTRRPLPARSPLPKPAAASFDTPPSIRPGAEYVRFLSCACMPTSHRGFVQVPHTRLAG